MSEGLYHVYAKYTIAPTLAGNGYNTNVGRWVTTFRNRMEADEYWRFISNQKTTPNGAVPYFSYLARNGPQFWQFTHADSNAWINLLSTLQPWGGNVMTSRLTTYGNEGAWLTIPNQASVDWTNGCQVFIRSRLNPDEYWHQDGPTVHIHIGKYRSKFTIRGIDLAPTDTTTVLIRSDKISIQVNDNDGVTLKKQYLSLSESGDNRLTISGTPYTWLFGDFFSRFGQRQINDEAGVTQMMIVDNPSTFVMWDLV